ncbi:MAG: hypothetical protein V7707_09295 [Motiliproteus sp.]
MPETFDQPSLRPAPRAQSFSGRLLLLLISLPILLSVSGCDFNVKNLAKNDVDMIVDQHILELKSLTDRLMVKLYKRNPRELAKAPQRTVNQRLRQLSSIPPNYRFAELSNKQGEAALELAFQPDYSGDRVFAFMVGLNSMLHASYNMQTELFLLDQLDQQLLYNSARNLEIINWRMNNFKRFDSKPYLLSNGYHNGIANLSFERLFGKMILIQDMMAKVVADKNNRTISAVIHSVASTTLLPIPF